MGITKSYILFSTCTNPIIHLFPPLPPPEKNIGLGIVLDISWDIIFLGRGEVKELYHGICVSREYSPGIRQQSVKKSVKFTLTYNLLKVAEMLAESRPVYTCTWRLFSLPHSKEEIEKKTLVLTTPDAQISSIWWLLTQFFGLQGGQEGYGMKMEDFRLHVRLLPCSQINNSMSRLLSLLQHWS